MIYAEASQAQVKYNGMGSLMLRLGGPVHPRSARETVEMTDEFDRPFIVDSSKFVNAFGEVSTPLHKAIRAKVDWYQQKFASIFAIRL